MNNRRSIFLALLVGVVVLGAFYPKSNFKEREALILEGVLNFIDAVHFQPKTIDDEFSKVAFNQYLENLDRDKRFLLQSEVDQLKTFELQIDDQVNQRTFEFFDLSSTMIANAYKRAQTICFETIELPIDITEDEYIELDGEKRTFVNDEAALRERWRKSIKYNVISELQEKIEQQEDAKKNKENGVETAFEDFSEEGKETEKEEEVFVEKTMDELKAEAIESVRKDLEGWFERLEKVRRSDRFEAYLGAITTYFDPHTSYFNPKEKQDFDINMGGKLEGIGARLQTDGDFTKVVSIIPGGPAWKGKELEVNDLITKVTNKDKEPLDITGMRIDDVVQQIRGKKGTIVTLAVKKKDGSMKDITIERDEVIIDVSFARSLILDIPDVIDNIGYIKLPKFYSSFEKEDGNSCAVDVAKEIEKLKENDVNGIILDLRNNSGGSLNDVVDMSGLFIEKGPIVQVKPKGRAPFIHKDKDPSVQYDGPLIVMVNHLSASASEILAAALQDYKRAVIVGGNSTFGKGTVQRFFDLDRAFRGSSEFKPLGNLKITVQKFFRVNGGSTQLRGVVPDIILPDPYHFIDFGEKEYDNALAFSEIEARDYNQNVVRLDNLDKLVKKSKARVGKSEDFTLALGNAKRLKQNRDLTNYPLSLDKFQTLIEKREKEAKKYEVLSEKEIEGLSIANLEQDKEYINSEESRVARNEDWLKNVKKDFYIAETLKIMKDMIELEDSFASVEAKLKN